MKTDILRPKTEYRTVRDMIEAVGEQFAERNAYSFRIKPHDADIVHITFSRLRDDVRSMATELAARGLTDRHCVLVGKLSYHWICTYYAVLSIGGVLVPLDRDWAADDLADTAKKADAAALICDIDIKDKAEAMLERLNFSSVVYIGEKEECGEAETVYDLISTGSERLSARDRSYFKAGIDPEALALLVFTSGTTGKGKGVMLSQKAILSNIADILQYIDFADKSVGVLPPHHTYGSTVSILGNLCAGVDLYLSSGIRYIQKELKEQKPGHLVMVPLYLETFYRKIRATIKDKGNEKIFSKLVKTSNTMLRAGIDIRRRMFASVLDAFGGEIKTIVTGGAPISRDILELFEAVGITVLNGYGITECAPIIAANHSRRNIEGSVGFPGAYNTVKIDNPNENGEGEICVKGSNVMIGYYKDEEATAAAFDSEGFFKTGDYGKFGRQGELYITGRLKNLIILSNGKNVYPEEIESEFAALPGVIDVIVYEGQSRRGLMYNTIVLEIFPDSEYLSKNGIEDAHKHFESFAEKYNKTAVPYKKIGLLRVRCEEFPKNTLRKIMRFKLDMTID